MKPVIVVHHHEIILKGNNRQNFERQLIKNTRRALADLLPASAVGGGYGRFLINPGDAGLGLVVERLSSVFGLSNVCAGLQVEQSMDELTSAAIKLLEGKQFKTFKVDTRRPDKNFAHRSAEVNREVGAAICARFGVRAQMTGPDETVFIEIADSTAFVYAAKVRGAGGLPSGISGRVVSLLSAGFDSPVASWQLMKRGATVVFVHFHSMPYVSRNSLDQVRRLAGVLSRFQFASRLYLIPFADIQNDIVAKTPPPFRVILYRRMMIRIAEEIVRREKAEALVTGDSVGQVASQTLRNIRAVSAVATFPILRPLAGMDKEETMSIARAIGTYDISKEPYDDCCSFLAPRKPETWANIEALEAAERPLDIPSLVAMGLRAMELERYSFPHVKEDVAAPA